MPREKRLDAFAGESRRAFLVVVAVHVVAERVACIFIVVDVGHSILDQRRMVGNDLPAAAPGNPGRRVSPGDVDGLTCIGTHISDFSSFNCGVVVDRNHGLFQKLG